MRTNIHQIRKTPLRIIALSGHAAALPSLNHLLKDNHLAALICPSSASEPGVTSLENWAADRGLPCWQVEPGAIENDLAELIRETTPDLLIVYGFPYHLPLHLLQQVKHGAWNVNITIRPSDQGSIIIHQLAKGIAGDQVLHQCHVSLLPPGEAGSGIEQLSRLSMALLQSSIRDMN